MVRESAAHEDRRIETRTTHLPVRASALLLPVTVFFALAALAQHGGSHPAPQHAPAPPHVSSPRPSAPSHVPQYNAPPYRAPQYQPVPQPRPQYAPPGGAPQFRGAAPYGNVPPGYAPRTPYSQPYGAPRPPYVAPPGRGNPPYITNQQHLGGWLQSHQGESFAGQANALRHEQGFSNLPQQQQQRLIDRLHQLNSMPPAQRQRTLGRIENMERLSPERRQAVRNSAEELSAMDPARKQQVRGAFRALRDMPPAERQQMLNSPEFRSQYNDHERRVLGNLLSVEPYQPR